MAKDDTKTKPSLKTVIEATPGDARDSEIHRTKLVWTPQHTKGAAAYAEGVENGKV
jgi:hypothetical protein